MLALNGLVQLLDAAIGVWQHDLAKTLGPACFAALLAAAWLLLRRGGRELGPGAGNSARGPGTWPGTGVMAGTADGRPVRQPGRPVTPHTVDMTRNLGWRVWWSQAAEPER
jgi:hypothetical protein